MPGRCGDPYCRSCGPAQGHWCCDVCGEWDGECDDPEACRTASKAIAELESKAEEERLTWEERMQREGLDD